MDDLCTALGRASIDPSCETTIRWKGERWPAYEEEQLVARARELLLGAGKSIRDVRRVLLEYRPHSWCVTVELKNGAMMVQCSR